MLRALKNLRHLTIAERLHQIHPTGRSSARCAACALIVPSKDHSASRENKIFVAREVITFLFVGVNYPKKMGENRAKTKGEIGPAIPDMKVKSAFPNENVDTCTVGPQTSCRSRG